MTVLITFTYFYRKSTFVYEVKIVPRVLQFVFRYFCEKDLFLLTAVNLLIRKLTLHIR